MPQYDPWLPRLDEGRHRMTLIKPPRYDDPGKPTGKTDNNGEEILKWYATVQYNGSRYSWGMYWSEFRAFKDAGEPGAGAVVEYIRGGRGKGNTVVVIEPGDSGSRQTQPAQPSQQPASPARTEPPRGPFSVEGDIQAHVFATKKLMSAMAQAGLSPDENASPAEHAAYLEACFGKSTNVIMEWQRNGRPALHPPANQQPETRGDWNDRQDEEPQRGPQRIQGNPPPDDDPIPF